MSDYRAKLGHGIALGSLTVLNPQPRSAGVQAMERLFSLNGEMTEYGLFIELVWDFLESPAQAQALYLLFGFYGSASPLVTIHVPSFDYSYERYNGRAIRPQPTHTNFFPRNVAILVRDLVLL